MSKDSDRTEALRRELVSAIVDETGMREVMALPLANSVLAYLQRQYAGERLYIPAPPRQYDVLLIKAELERGDSINRVCTTHGMSRTTLYRLFPGGMPQKAVAAA